MQQRIQEERHKAFLEKLAQRQAEFAAQGFAAEESVLPVCPTCGDMGQVRYDVPYGDPNFGKLKSCPEPSCRVANENRQRSWERLLASAKIPDDYQKFTFESWDALPESEKDGKWAAYAACKLFVERPDHFFALDDVATYLGVQSMETGRAKNCIVLYGEPGTGKTGLVVALANALLQTGKLVLYTRARDLIEEVQKDYRPDSERKALDLFKTASILVIDECNINYYTGDRKDIFEGVIRARYGDGMPTIVTCNINQEQFEEEWGLRTAHVLWSMAHWINVHGTVLRKTESPIGA